MTINTLQQLSQLTSTKISINIYSYKTRDVHKQKSYKCYIYLTLRIYLAARHCGHVAAKHILILTTKCYGITNLLLRKFTFTENQTFLRNFYSTKIWSHTVCYRVLIK